MTPNDILIFSAGVGSRMRPLTDNMPKPLINVAGKPLIDHALALVADVPVQNRVVNLHYKAQMIRDHLAGSTIVYSDETDALLETGGGLRHALPLFTGQTVFTLNTDAVWRGPNPLVDLLAAWEPAKMDALLHLVPTKNAIGHKGAGDFKYSPGGPLQQGLGHVYTGAQIIKTQTLNLIEEPVFSLRKLWDVLIERERLFGLETSVKWCDVGQPESIPLAEAMLENADA